MGTFLNKSTKKTCRPAPEKIPIPVSRRVPDKEAWSRTQRPKKTVGAQLNPEAPIFEVSGLKPVMSVKPTMVVRPPTKLIANPFEEIISFKLLYYEAKIEINKKDEEIQRLREI